MVPFLSIETFGFLALHVKQNMEKIVIREQKNTINFGCSMYEAPGATLQKINVISSVSQWKSKENLWDL